MKLFIIGMPGSGKSFIAEMFAEKTGAVFFDTDLMIEKKYNKSIAEIFKTEGENVFRKYETELLENFNYGNNFVVATGGGMPCYNDNLKIMSRIGVSVYLKANPKIIVERLLKSKIKRPVIKEKNKNLILYEVEKMLSEREKFYLKADYIVDASLNAKNILKSKPFNL